MKPIAEDSRHVGEQSTIDKISNGSKIGEVKFEINSQAKLSKSQNKIMPSLTKFQLLAKLSSRLGFLIPGARLAVAELR